MSVMLSTYISILDALGSAFMRRKERKAALEALFMAAMDSRSLNSDEKLEFEAWFLYLCWRKGLLPKKRRRRYP
jgi:hypothetical protein